MALVGQQANEGGLVAKFEANHLTLHVAGQLLTMAWVAEVGRDDCHFVFPLLDGGGRRVQEADCHCQNCSAWRKLFGCVFVCQTKSQASTPD